MLAVLILGNFLFLPVTPEATLPSELRFPPWIDSLLEDDVPGREPLVLGGSGKAPMLIVLRTDLGGRMALALPAADGALEVGRLGVDPADCGVGRAEGLGAFKRDGVSGRLFRVLGCGMAGSAPVGGSAAGREGTGRDMVLDAVLDVTQVFCYM